MEPLGSDAEENYKIEKLRTGPFPLTVQTSCEGMLVSGSLSVSMPSREQQELGW